MGLPELEGQFHGESTRPGHFLIRPTFAILLATLAAPALALDLDALVTKHSAANGVPETLVRRVIHIESRGNPRVISKGNYGLMQIRYGTAKAMGYTGTPEGLLDADTNMTYAVRYLAGAYRAANGDPNRAVNLYQRGYYAEAKAKHFSPYSLASTTSTPVELHKQKPAEKTIVASEEPSAKTKALAAKRGKPIAPPEPATPVEALAVAPAEKPATLQERFAAAMPTTPPGKPTTKVTKVKAVAAPHAPAQPAPAVAVTQPVVTAAAPPVVSTEKSVAAPILKPSVPAEKAATPTPAPAAVSVAPPVVAVLPPPRPAEQLAATISVLPRPRPQPQPEPQPKPATVAVAAPVAPANSAMPSDTSVMMFAAKPVGQPERFVAPSHQKAIAALPKPVAVPAAPAPDQVGVTLATPLAATPPEKPARPHRRAKPDNKPFNLMSYLTKLVKSEPAKQPRRQRAQRRVAPPADGTPMLSAATP